MAISNAPVCGKNSRENLRKSAGWLISTLTWIPDDKDTVTFIENFDMTETLFELAMNARKRECNEIAKKVGEILLSWTFKGGRYQTGWGVLERGLLGLSVFAQTVGHKQTKDLKNAVKDHLSGTSAPEQNIRDQVARKILERSLTLFRQGHWGSRIEQAIARADHEKLRPLLEDIAKILSPNLTHQKSWQAFGPAGIGCCGSRASTVEQRADPVRAPCLHRDINRCWPSTTHASGWPAPMSIPASPNAYKS